MSTPVAAPLDSRAIAPFARQEIARRRFLDYCGLMISGFDAAAAHVRYWCAILEQVETGDIKRLILTAPPGHGKSTVTQAWVSWFLGRRERRRVLLLSASERLTIRNSRLIRAHVQDERYPFAAAALSTEAVGEWQLVNGSGIRAAGAGAIITGFRAEAAILDDVQADRGTLESRNELEFWLRAVMSTRLEPGGVIVAICTRWGTDDLVARLKAGEDGDRWLHVNLPAIATGDDPHMDRKPGESLWPARWSASELEARRIEVGSNEFETQYQGNPSPDGGFIFREEWMQQRYRFGDHPTGLRIIQSIDSAWKESTGADWSVIATWAASATHFYLLDIWRRQVEFPKLKAAVVAQRALWRPEAIVVEQAASGWAIVQSLRAETKFPIIGIPSTSSKISRVEAVSPLFEAGRVMLPDRAPFLDAWISEHLRFGTGSGKDDQVDTTSLALARLSQRPVAWSFASASTSGGRRKHTPRFTGDAPPPKPIFNVHTSEQVWPRPGVTPVL